MYDIIYPYINSKDQEELKYSLLLAVEYKAKLPFRVVNGVVAGLDSF